MDHPYKNARAEAFWRRGVAESFDTTRLVAGPLLKAGDKVVSAGSCFAANIVPFITKAGFEYIKTEKLPEVLTKAGEDNFSYSKFSAAYGNIYTAGQAKQLLQRALGQFCPREDRWELDSHTVIDSFRPGLKFPAGSNREFDAIRDQHLRRTLDAIRLANVFVFTLGLTEAWLSRADGAVFPACPGTIAGSYDPDRHVFHNFTSAEVTRDLGEFIVLARQLNPRLRFVLTVSPVPLVATATAQHVLLATIYSKSVLRVAAQEVAASLPEVTYFPAYEIVTGPQAPYESFEADRREPTAGAIATVMRSFLSACETDAELPQVLAAPAKATAATAARSEPVKAAAPAPSTVAAAPAASSGGLEDLGAFIAAALCEEAAQDG